VIALNSYHPCSLGRQSECTYLCLLRWDTAHSSRKKVVLPSSKTGRSIGPPVFLVHVPCRSLVDCDGVPVRFVATEIALNAGKKRNSSIRNLQVEPVRKDSSSGGPFSRKTDGTKLQKPPNRKFFYSFIYNDLRHFPRKKSPEFRKKRAGPSNYGGRLLFAPKKEYRAYADVLNAKHPNHGTKIPACPFRPPCCCSYKPPLQL
jgi:hypothetical protein